MAGADIAEKLHGFELTVTGQLATLIQQTANLEGEVRRQNGNVARLWQRSDALAAELAASRAAAAAELADIKATAAAELAAIKGAVEAESASRRAATHASKRWEGWVRPVVLAVLTGLLGWLLRNPKPLVEAVTR